MTSARLNDFKGKPELVMMHTRMPKPFVYLTHLNDCGNHLVWVLQLAHNVEVMLYNSVRSSKELRPVGGSCFSANSFRVSGYTGFG